MRRSLGIDVLTAARQRISETFDDAERVYISFSGGKDSTVMLHLVMEEAIRRDRKVGLLFVDLEAQYRLTIEHVAACFERYAAHVEPYWVALPLNLRNAVSQFEPQWMCWDPEARDRWVRQPGSTAITDEARFPFFARRMEFEAFVPAFAEWYAQGKPTACFVGIRTDESLNRWRSVTSRSKGQHNGRCWTTIKGHRIWNAYPLYDWRTEDIWTYHARYPDMPTNRTYELMHRAGLTIHQARICQPYGDDQRRGLWLFHLLEPETWGRVVARVCGTNQGALYAQERGNVLGVGKIELPEGLTWRSYADLLLTSMPGPTAEHYRTKIDVFLKWWAVRGFSDGIPDEASPDQEAARKAPSWRRICKALLRNDYWCKGLSFSQHKDTTSYARYNAIMRVRRGIGGSAIGPGIAWEYACGPDQPGRLTHKQLAMLASLTGGSTPDHAWRALGRLTGQSGPMARQTATTDDAARAIETLRSAEADYRAETYTNTPKAKQGDPALGLLGERDGRTR